VTLVTVVMPVWRPRPDWLAEAVESTLSEHGCDLELLLVDDGCEPPVEEILRVADPRLRILRREHAGVAGARNAGMAEARGEYLRFLDADDVAAPGSTSLLLGLSAGRSGVVTYGATAVCDEMLRPTTLLVSDVEGSAEVPCLLGRFDVRVVSLLFPRRVVELTGAWNDVFPISVDWDFVLRALAHAEVRGSRTLATYYRRHSGSLTRTTGIAAGERARALIIDGFFERHPELAGTRLEQRARAGLELDRGLAFAAAGEPAAAARRVLRAALRDPGAAVGPAAWVARTAVGDVLTRRRQR
jgi:glycosyltransferase involved in cell wall biosynthesis